MKYIAVRDCHGFRGRFWKEGEGVDAEEGEILPRHFVPADQYKPRQVDPKDPWAQKPGKDIPRPLSSMRIRIPVNKRGFASSLGDDEPKKPMTAGQIKKG